MEKKSKMKLKNTLMIALVFATIIHSAQHIWDDGAQFLNVRNGDVVEIRDGATGTLSVPNGATITITRGGDRFFCPSDIRLNIPARSRVVWKAGMFCSKIDSHFYIDGDGQFEIADRLIVNTRSVISAKNITVSGGVVLSSLVSDNITISDGSVSHTYSFNTTISGGYVDNVFATGSLTVSGGRIVGKVHTGEIEGINMRFEKNAPFRMSGGVIISQGSSLADIVSAPTGNIGGVIVAYELGTYTEGTRNGIRTLPRDANVSWGIGEAHQYCLEYSCEDCYDFTCLKYEEFYEFGVNIYPHGFFQISDSGLTVKPRDWREREEEARRIAAEQQREQARIRAEEQRIQDSIRTERQRIQREEERRRQGWSYRISASNLQKFVLKSPRENQSNVVFEVGKQVPLQQDFSYVIEDKRISFRFRDQRNLELYINNSLVSSFSLRNGIIRKITIVDRNPNLGFGVFDVWGGNF